MDDHELLRRQPDLLAVEACERIGDADHPRRAPRQQPLGDPERTGPERVVVVLGRDERRPAGAESTEDVRVHEVRVDEIGPVPPQVAHEPCRRVGARERHAATLELVVERVRVRQVEPGEGDLDAALGERGQERQQMPLGAADPRDPVGMHDPHRRRRSQRWTSATPASTASRKSHGAR